MTTEVTPDKEAETEVKEDAQPGLADLLKAYDGAPSQEQIDQWKVTYGEVFVSGFSEEDLYIWRPITRQEWRTVQETVQTPDTEGKQLSQLDFEELVCATCVLWQASKTSLQLKGGTATTLHEQVLQNSNFVAPQAAQMFVARL